MVTAQTHFFGSVGLRIEETWPSSATLRQSSPLRPSVYPHFMIVDRPSAQPCLPPCDIWGQLHSQGPFKAKKKNRSKCASTPHLFSVVPVHHFFLPLSPVLSSGSPFVSFLKNQNRIRLRPQTACVISPTSSAFSSRASASMTLPQLEKLRRGKMVRFLPISSAHQSCTRVTGSHFPGEVHIPKMGKREHEHKF